MNPGKIVFMSMPELEMYEKKARILASGATLADWDELRMNVRHILMDICRECIELVAPLKKMQDVLPEVCKRWTKTFQAIHNACDECHSKFCASFPRASDIVHLSEARAELVRIVIAFTGPDV